LPEEGEAMAAHASQVIEEGWRKIAPLEERIRRHPYLQALEAKEVDRGKLAIFAGQQRHIIESDLRSVSVVVTRSESQATRDFFIGMLQGERAALEALEPFGRALGLSAEELRAAEPLPGAFAYSAYVAWLALYASPAEFAGAFLVNLDAWGVNCGRISRALTARYGLSTQEVAFFDLFATAPPGFEGRALAVVDEGLARGLNPERIHRAARMLQGYELLYWDTILEATRA
jgi:pyrroloquinoline quinone (PQQ) biosynthesis protein C